MISRRHVSHRPRWSLSFGLLLVLLLAVWMAGGASRADEAGQAVVRGIAAGTLAVAVLFVPWRARDWPPAVCALMLAMIVLPLLQLVPLPPEWWLALPRRIPFEQAVEGAQPWRPLAIAPDAALDALTSLWVPLAVLALVSGLRPSEREALLPVLLLMVAASMLVGLAQLSGIRFDNPWINYDPGRVSGTFANRNHFALFLALGCLLAPAWAVQGGRPSAHWRFPIALGLVAVFLLLIMATGSRAGLLAGAAAVVTGMLLVRAGGREVLPRGPVWMAPAAGLAASVVVAALVVLDIVADRAQSIGRAAALDVADDMRVRALPTVVAMVRDYFPAGIGFGGFDPLFRLHEPDALLKPTYFNHAHDDFLEVALEGGLPAMVLIAAGGGWWAFASKRAWTRAGEGVAARAGSAGLLLIMLASLFDYPARTPLIMAIAMICAVWLDRPRNMRGTATFARWKRSGGTPEYI